jgi:hypothetical protein
LNEAQFLALPVNGIDEIAAPAAQSYDCSVYHELKSFCSSLRNSSFVRCILSGRCLAARVGSIALGAGIALAKTLSAASYPTRRIRIMVGSPLAEASIRHPHARAAPHTLLGVSVIVRNRPGAGGTIATDLIARRRRTSIPSL